MKNINYLLGAIISLPLLPLMYYQAKIIKRKIPDLPEAKGKEGTCKISSIVERNCIRVISIGESTIASVGVRTHEEGFTGVFAKEMSILSNNNVSWKVYARSGITVKNVCNLSSINI